MLDNVSVLKPINIYVKYVKLFILQMIHIIMIETFSFVLIQLVFLFCILATIHLTE